MKAMLTSRHALGYVPEILADALYGLVFSVKMSSTARAISGEALMAEPSDILRALAAKSRPAYEEALACPIFWQSAIVIPRNQCQPV